MAELEQTLDSREVAGMVEKDHNKLLRDIRRYVEQLGEAKIGHSDFFRESTYRSEQRNSLLQGHKERLRIYRAQADRNKGNHLYSKIHKPISRNAGHSFTERE